MTRQEAARVVKYADRDVVKFVLLRVNLTRREAVALNLTVSEGLTNFDASEEMKASERAVSEWKNTALDKCCRAWEGWELAKLILAASE